MGIIYYIKTSDGVLIRFESIETLKKWIEEGKVREKDFFLTDDKQWKPLEEVLIIIKEKSTKQEPPPKKIVKQEEPLWTEPTEEKTIKITEETLWGKDEGIEEALEEKEFKKSRLPLIITLIVVFCGIVYGTYYLYNFFTSIPFPQKKEIPSAPEIEMVKESKIFEEIEELRLPIVEEEIIEEEVEKIEEEKMEERFEPPARKVKTKPIPEEEKRKDNYEELIASSEKLMEEDPQKAISILMSASRLMPHKAEPLRKIGYSYLKLGNYENAINYFKKALINNKFDDPSYIGLARAYKSSGNQSEAKRYYEDYLKLKPDGKFAKEAQDFIKR